MTAIPDDDTLLKLTRDIQHAQGAQVGLQKIYDHIKAEHPLWSFSLKRLRDVRKKNNLAPPPPSSATSSLVSPLVLDNASASRMLTLDLIFWVGTDPNEIIFKEPIPAEYCVKGVSRDLTGQFIQGLIGLREPEVMQMRKWKCLYCHKRATRLFVTPMVTLLTTPPTVNNLSQPICEVSVNCSCTRDAYARLRDGMADPDSPYNTFGEETVITMPGRNKNL